MERESSLIEVLRLLKEQHTARQDEVFGGLCPAERAEYNRKAKRINDLEIELGQDQVRTVISDAAAQLSSGWRKTSETDTHQADARQPYRDRENCSNKAQKARPARANRPPDGPMTNEE
jgi:hypothetical protein